MKKDLNQRTPGSRRKKVDNGWRAPALGPTMKSHSYKLVKFRCAECDFVGENDLTMDVHVGRNHADDFECGLCENKFESVESLEILRS